MHLRRKLDKIIAVTADAHHEIAVCLGIFNGIFQNRFIRYVDLQFKTATLHINLDQSLHNIKKMLSERTLRKFDIDGNAADQF